LLIISSLEQIWRWFRGNFALDFFDPGQPGGTWRKHYGHKLPKSPAAPSRDEKELWAQTGRRRRAAAGREIRAEMRGKGQHRGGRCHGI